MLIRFQCLLAITVLIAAAGCGSSNTPNAPNTPPPPTIGQIYVGRDIVPAMFRFKAGDNGNVAPQALVSASPDPIHLSLDVAHNRLAAGGGSNFQLFDNVSAGFSAPRIISTPIASIRPPQSIALDGTADVLYVADNSSTILVFGPASTMAGNVAPLRTLTIAAITGIGGIAVDGANNRLFVSDPENNAIEVFDNASSLSGAVVANRVISGATTKLSSPGALSLDNSGRLIVSAGGFTENDVLVFANPGLANGDVAPAIAVSLPATPVFTSVAVSPTGELYAANDDFSIAVYNITNASGAITPVRVIAGSNTQLNPNLPTPPGSIFGIAVDPTR
jgi:hypothetical protein